MNKKHFIVYFVFLVTMAISLPIVRGQDCDPTSGCNEQSFCVPNGFCSCLSGFSGDSCVEPPQSSCSSSYKDPNGSESLDSQVEFSVTLNTLFIQINTSLEKNMYKDSSATPLEEDDNSQSIYSLGTTITWAGSSSCDYPSPLFWKKLPVADGLCLDSYTLSMDIRDAIPACGFTYDSSTNLWSNSVTITRYYSQPADMTIVDPSRRAEGRPMISIASETTLITIPSDDEPKAQEPATDSNQDEPVSSPQEEKETSQSQDETKKEPYDRALFIKIAAAIAGAVGVAFIATIIVVVAIRRRRSRKAEAQFNFEGISSN